MPYTKAQLEASLAAILTLLATAITNGEMVSSYTLPTGVTVDRGMRVDDLIRLQDMYQKLLRSYYPTMAISRGY